MRQIFCRSSWALLLLLQAFPLSQQAKATDAVATDAFAVDSDAQNSVELQWFDLNDHTKPLEWRTATRWIWTKDNAEGLNLPAVPMLELWIEVPQDVSLTFPDYDMKEFGAGGETNMPLTPAPGYKLVRVATQSPKLAAQARNNASGKEPFGVRISIIIESTKLLIHRACKERGIDLAPIKTGANCLFLAAFCDGQTSAPVIKLVASMDAFFVGSNTRYRELAYSLESSPDTQQLGTVHLGKKFDDAVAEYQLVRKKPAEVLAAKEKSKKISWLWLADMANTNSNASGAENAHMSASESDAKARTVRLILEMAPNFVYYEFDRPTGADSASEFNLMMRAIVAYRWHDDWAARVRFDVPLFSIAPETPAFGASGAYVGSAEAIYSAYARGNTTMYLLFGAHTMFTYMRETDRWSRPFFGPSAGFRLAQAFPKIGGRRLLGGVEISPLLYSGDPVFGSHLFYEFLASMELTKPVRPHKLRWDAVLTHYGTLTDTQTNTAPDRTSAISLGLRAIY